MNIPQSQKVFGASIHAGCNVSEHSLRSEAACSLVKGFSGFIFV